MLCICYLRDLNFLVLNDMHDKDVIVTTWLRNS
uniref:Uncharacterized protein n=1 Tax=Rhizophora mucronata TaxID=61149 RepID=A0A2P2QY44_RHIMU